MELKLGTLVTPAERTWRRVVGIGRVIEDPHDPSLAYMIRWATGNTCTHRLAFDLVRVCEQCHKEWLQHTHYGRCLFGASTWR